ncbi:hypothetical protein PG984_008124 [Apiospora sp. TS-2023a]
MSILKGFCPDRANLTPPDLGIQHTDAGKNLERNWQLDVDLDTDYYDDARKLTVLRGALFWAMGKERDVTEGVRFFSDYPGRVKNFRRCKYRDLSDRVWSSGGRLGN